MSEFGVVEVNGGIADVSQGNVYIIDWDNIANDFHYGLGVFEDLDDYPFDQGVADSIRERLLAIWPTFIEDEEDEEVEDLPEEE